MKDTQGGNWLPRKELCWRTAMLIMAEHTKRMYQLLEQPTNQREYNDFSTVESLWHQFREWAKHETQKPS